MTAPSLRHSVIRSLPDGEKLRQNVTQVIDRNSGEDHAVELPVGRGARDADAELEPTAGARERLADEEWFRATLLESAKEVAVCHRLFLRLIASAVQVDPSLRIGHPDGSHMTELAHELADGVLQPGVPADLFPAHSARENSQFLQHQRMGIEHVRRVFLDGQHRPVRVVAYIVESFLVLVPGEPRRDEQGEHQSQ